MATAIPLAPTTISKRVRWRNSLTGDIESRTIRHVFVMTGAEPATSWLDGCLALDPRGFVLTGPDLATDTLAEARWPLQRSPYLLETSLPGVFATGDVRAGNVNRVASAEVGERWLYCYPHDVMAGY